MYCKSRRALKLSLTCSDRLSPKLQDVASPLGAPLNAVYQDGTRTTRRSSKDSLRSMTHIRLVPQPGTELSRAQGVAWVRDYQHGSALLTSITKIYITLEAASSTQYKMECTAEGQACAHSGDPFMLLRLQPSAKTYTLHESRKALFEGMKHKLSLTILAGTSPWAITPLCFSPPTFINFSLVVTSLTYLS